MYRAVRIVFTVMLLFPSASCDVIDRDRNRGVAADSTNPSASSGGLTLGLQTPGVLRPGEEGVVRLSLTNQGDDVPRGVRLDLLVPGWLEPMPPRPGDRAVTMSTSAEEGTRFSYRLDDPPLEAGQAQTVEQRIRVPVPNPIMDGATPWSRVVRARLVGPGGESLAEVASEISLEGATPGDSLGGAAQAGEPGAAAERLGPVRLGMPAASLRQSVTGARDSTWTAEGVPERGVIVPVEGGGRAIALVQGDTVVRIEVRDSVLRTREGLGVGSRLDQLHAAYGRSCVGVGEGNTVVWFPSKPGISFALDASAGRAGGQARPSSEQLPPSSRVTRWWIRRGTDRCP